ncbi:hypothetical protein KJ640_02090, partial [bacterium]|nr:hypothetical protein [bacterium]
KQKSRISDSESRIEKDEKKIEKIIEPKVEEKQKSRISDSESRIEKDEKKIEKIIEPTENVLPKKEIVVATAEQPPLLPAKKEDKSATYKLISKVEIILEKAEEEGAERYAKKSFSLAKKMLSQAKKEVSYEKAMMALTEAERCLKETLEKREQYDSGYISGLIKDFGK